MYSLEIDLLENNTVETVYHGFSIEITVKKRLC